MRTPSLIQCRLFISPQLGFMSSFAWVTCRQWPAGPAHNSGGCAGELRTAAEFSRSAENDIEIDSGPDHSFETFPLASSTAEMPDSPSMFSVNRISALDFQKIAFGEAAISEVTFRAFPPPAGTTKISPPVEPSSLISPSIKAMLMPSGDQRGSAICQRGL